MPKKNIHQMLSLCKTHHMQDQHLKSDHLPSRDKGHLYYFLQPLYITKLKIKISKQNPILDRNGMNLSLLLIKEELAADIMRRIFVKNCIIWDFSWWGLIIVAEEGWGWEWGEGEGQKVLDMHWTISISIPIDAWFWVPTYNLFLILHMPHSSIFSSP